MIDMDKNLSELIEYPSDGILSKVILKNDRLDVTLFCMAQGTEMSEHTSTKQGLVHVIEGKGAFTIKGKPIDMLPGTLIHMNENEVHSLKADENTSFLLILVKESTK